jgi:selenide,water dikinase
MQAATTPIVRDIVLIGGGHSHVVVLRRFRHAAAARRAPDGDLHRHRHALLRHAARLHRRALRFDEVHIDLRRLAEFAGARYFRDEVVGIDRARAGALPYRPPVPYDALSINIGSTPQLGAGPGAAEHAVPVKPIRRFNERWLALLERVRPTPGRRRSPWSAPAPAASS